VSGPFGLLPTGFVPKTVNDVVADLQQAFQNAFGKNILLSPQSRNGQIIGIFADRFAELWNLAQAVNASQQPDNSTGVSFDSLCGLTGTKRQNPLSSTVTGTLTGTPATVLLTGKQASVVGTGVKFQTLADATLAAVTVWAAYTAVLGDRRTNVGNVYQCTTPGNSVTGPVGTGSGIADGGAARWLYLGAGTAAVDVAMGSVDPGAKVATSGSLTTIETPFAGWSGVINVLDAVLGRDVEQDGALRTRREGELRGAGNSAVDAIRSKLIKVAGVTTAFVFDNPLDVVDPNGMPPHSVEALVVGGLNQDILNAVWAATSGGIQTTGNQTGSVTDTQGFAHTVKYSRPAAQNVYVIVNVIYDASKFPVNGATLIQNQIALTYGGKILPDYDVVASAIGGQVFMTPGILPGLLDVTSVLIGLAPTPTLSVTIPISSRQIAAFDTSRITVNLTPGIP
jgi:uncharacterized phage protein gp47/JayE